MDSKSKIVLVIGIILSIAGLVSLVSASWGGPDCRVILTPPAGSSYTSVPMPLGCQFTTEEIPTVEVPENVIQRLGSQGGGY